MKTSVKEIEAARAEARKRIANVMHSKSDTKNEEVEAVQDNFNNETKDLDVRLICSVGREHGSSDYTLTVANAE